jgi:hypothetical protein
MLGGAEIVVDSKKVDPGKCFTYKGAMLSDVPNMAFVFGYTNASWTLRADLINEYVCRLINYLDMYDLASATPRLGDEAPEPKPFANLNSGYFARADNLLPKQTAKAPWKQNQSYAHDMMDLRFGALEDGVLEMKPRRQRAQAPVDQRHEAVAAE